MMPVAYRFCQQLLASVSYNATMKTPAYFLNVSSRFVVQKNKKTNVYIVIIQYMLGMT